MEKNIVDMDDVPLPTYYHCRRPPGVEGWGHTAQHSAHTWGKAMENKAMRGNKKCFGDHCTTTITIHRVTLQRRGNWTRTHADKGKINMGGDK